MNATQDIPHASHELHHLLELLKVSQPPISPSPGTPGEASGMGDCPRAGREGVPMNDVPAEVILTVWT